MLTTIRRRYWIILALFGLITLIIAQAGGSNRSFASPLEQTIYANNYAPHQLLVRFAPNATRATRETLAQRYGVVDARENRYFEYVTWHFAKDVDVVALSQALEDEPQIANVDFDWLMYPMDEVPDDPDLGLQWALDAIYAPRGWQYTTGDPSITIAIVDTGVDLDHPDLQNKLTDPATWIDVADNDSDPDDFHPNSHGTHVAGIAGAESDNGIGIAGVSWDAQIMPVKVFANGAVTTTTSTVAQGILHAVNHGADVINLSLGRGTPTFDMVYAIEYAVRHDVVVVAAAGNGDNMLRTYPAVLDGVIGVAATSPDDTKWSGSTYGSWVDVSAPGDSIHSTMIGGYGSLSGTSMAAPHVAGLAALLLAQNPTWTPEQVEARIEESADIFDDINVEYNYRMGSGRINVYKALRPIEIYEPTACWTQMLLPLYIYPNHWDAPNYVWDDVATANNQVPITAIINPEDGPVPPTHGNYADYVVGMNELNSTGTKMVGYVLTDYGAADINAVKAQVDLYVQHYSSWITGIFFDQVPSSAASLAYYQELYDYAHAQTGFDLVILNPGTGADEPYIAEWAADTIGLFEGSNTEWTMYTPPEYMIDSYHYPGGSYAHDSVSPFLGIIYDVPDVPTMEARFHDLMVARFHHVYITDDSGSNPFDTLPVYWQELVDHFVWRNQELCQSNIWCHPEFPDLPAIIGDDFDNMLNGLEIDERICGRGGNDEVQGWGGDDVVAGNRGNDFVNGHLGADIVYGGQHNDWVRGGNGDDGGVSGDRHDDFVAGDLGNDVNIAGASGNDVFYYYAGDGSDEIEACEDIDRLIIAGVPESNLDYEASGNDYLIHINSPSPTGVITLTDYYVGACSSTLTIDVQSFDQLGCQMSAAVLESPTYKMRFRGDSGDNNIVGSDLIQHICGLSGNDTIEGLGSADHIEGNSGEDLLLGGAESDALHGGDDDDFLFAGEGDDILYGDRGSDWLGGGAGDDAYFYHIYDGNDVIEDCEGNNEIRLSSWIAYETAVVGDDLVLMLDAPFYDEQGEITIKNHQNGCGQFIVLGGVDGDADGNGSADDYDRLFVLHVIVDIEEENSASDVNADTTVDAGDIACLERVFDGDSVTTCYDGGRQSAGTPMINFGLPQVGQDSVTYPLEFSSGGESVVATVVSLDIDEANLSLDETDGDGDGIPDAIVFNTSTTVETLVISKPTDTDSELMLLLIDTTGTPLPEGEFASVTLTVDGSLSADPSDNIDCASEPYTSFGLATGQSVHGLCDNLAPTKVNSIFTFVSANRWIVIVLVFAVLGMTGITMQVLRTSAKRA